MTTIVRVSCSACGKLGECYVTPEQHLEGARSRADTLAGHHRHWDKVMVMESEE